MLSDRVRSKINEPDTVDLVYLDLPRIDGQQKTAVPRGAPELPNERRRRTVPLTAALVAIGPGAEAVFGREYGQEWAIAPERVADNLDLPFPDVLRLDA